MDEHQQPGENSGQPRRMTRRAFLKLAGVVLVSTSVVTAVESCSPKRGVQPPSTSVLPVTGSFLQKYPEVPLTPEHLPTVHTLDFFTEHEAKTMDAIAGRIIPGTPDDPGAREADVFIYIDHKLAYLKNSGFVEPTYFKPPFAKPYEGDTPPLTPAGSEKVIWVKAGEYDRYGFQGGMPPQESYRKGLASVDKYANKQFHKDFADLSEAQQDQILDDMDNGKAQGQGFDQPSDRVFFKTLRDDVVEGMFSDPVYGGNKNMVGWSLIGYPGAQRAYTPVDMNTEDNIRPPQSIAQMHMFHPGQNANPDVVVPPSGSDVEQPQH